jgi:hypothetical protein
MPETVQLSSTAIVKAVARGITFILLPEPCTRILYHPSGNGPYRAETAVEAIESAGFDHYRHEATRRGGPPAGIALPSRQSILVLVSFFFAA